tara:strand:- start:558 stop:1133 length:576 start_codon:yes stop_codon:yes gene_type:complete
MSKKLIIFQHEELFKILNEINENFGFELEFCEKKKDLESLDNKNLKNYLVISKKKISNLNNQIIIDTFPININELNQILNINFLKSKFNEQSKMILGKYILDLNSRILKQNLKELELTEKECSILVFLKQSKEPVKINELQEKVWGYNSELETHTVETHIYRLRKKISNKFFDNEMIISDKKGYFLNEKKK